MITTDQAKRILQGRPMKHASRGECSWECLPASKRTAEQFGFVMFKGDPSQQLVELKDLTPIYSSEE